MIAAFYILISLLVLFLLFKYQIRNIHAVEILVYWLVATILCQNYSALLYMNLKYIWIPDILSLEMANFINRTVLYPLLTILFLNRYIILTTLGKKISWVLFYGLILTSMEWLEAWLGVLVYTNGKMKWSFLFWLFYVLVSIGFMRYFRKKLNQGVPTS